MKFTRVKEDAFKELQVNAGILLNQFDPTGTTEVVDDHIITATTGGINASCVPTFSDYAEDVDNAPNNLADFKMIDGHDCMLTFTALAANEKIIAMALGASTTSVGASGEPTKVSPKKTLELADFNDVWWVGDKADGTFIAVHLMNALSESGFTLQTTKNGKGTISVTLRGHSTLATQDVVPMEFYVGETETATP